MEAEMEVDLYVEREDGRILYRAGTFGRDDADENVDEGIEMMIEADGMNLKSNRLVARFRPLGLVLSLPLGGDLGGSGRNGDEAFADATGAFARLVSRYLESEI